MVGGAYIIWDLGRAFAKIAELLSREPSSPSWRPQRRGRHPHAVVFEYARDRRAAGDRHQHVRHAARRRVPRSSKPPTPSSRRPRSRDEVTQLYNRRFFSLRLEEEISRFRRFNHPVSVVVLDLDGFKSVNDEFGHAVGDETLRDVGQILMKHSRGINVVSRYGGDEFAVLLVETSKSGARLYADRIRQSSRPSPTRTASASPRASASPAFPTTKPRRRRSCSAPPTERSTPRSERGKNQVVAAGPGQKVD